MNKYSNQVWYQVAKIIAENDSIGEGYSYCLNYTKEKFGEEVKKIEESQNKEGTVYNYASVAEEILKLLPN